MRNTALTGLVKVPPPSSQPQSNHSCPSLPNCTCRAKRDLAEPPLLSCRVQALKPSYRLLSRVRSTALARSHAQLVAVQRLWLLMGLDFDSLKSGLSGEPDGLMPTRSCPFGPGEPGPRVSLCIFSLRLARAATTGGAQVRGHARSGRCSWCTVR